MATRRQRTAQRALAQLGADRFERFIRTLGPERPHSVKYLLNHLDQGETLESVLLADDEFGYVLAAKRLGRNCFRIRFGYQCPPSFHAGDLSEWDVQFNDDRTVASITPGMALIF